MRKSKFENYEVRDEDLELLLEKLGHSLKDAMPPDHGFTLVISSFEPGGGTFYISSIQRADALKILKEVVERIEKQIK